MWRKRVEAEGSTCYDWLLASRLLAVKTRSAEKFAPLAQSEFDSRVAGTEGGLPDAEKRREPAKTAVGAFDGLGRCRSGTHPHISQAPLLPLALPTLSPKVPGRAGLSWVRYRGSHFNLHSLRGPSLFPNNLKVRDRHFSAPFTPETSVDRKTRTTRHVAHGQQAPLHHLPFQPLAGPCARYDDAWVRQGECCSPGQSGPDHRTTQPGHGQLWIHGSSPRCRPMSSVTNRKHRPRGSGARSSPSLPPVHLRRMKEGVVMPRRHTQIVCPCFMRRSPSKTHHAASNQVSPRRRSQHRYHGRHRQAHPIVHMIDHGSPPRHANICAACFLDWLLSCESWRPLQPASQRGMQRRCLSDCPRTPTAAGQPSFNADIPPSVPVHPAGASR
jgi:hypothetical protein